MTACPNYRADPHDYQQLDPWTPTSPFDCSPTTGAWLAAMDSCGAVRITGRQVRLNSSERIPDPASPGLNFPQVDAAVYRASNERVNLGRGAGGLSATTTIATAQKYISAGRAIGWQFDRGRLGKYVKGLMTANGFTGLHAGGLVAHPFGSLRLYDPLVKIYLPVTWTAVRYAAINGSSVPGTGFINLLYARDVVPSDYYVRIDAGERFARYKVEDDEIVGIRGDILDDAVVRKCSRVDSKWYPAFKSYRNVVRLANSADPDYAWVSVDSPAVHYTEVLP